MAQALRSRIDEWSLMKLKNSSLIPHLIRVMSKIYNECKKLNSNKQTNNPIKNWGIDLNRVFTTAESLIAEKHLKKFSKSLIIRETQMKTTLRF
ncbi:rCG38065 [Rattus norvegicus]|uniref:RCG38065 n=1 Tax=Rattus norvegicus TaxID=10116 RepID=A6IV91_RAT|nr:rCG38065 [Rattus norvegicus]